MKPTGKRAKPAKLTVSTLAPSPEASRQPLLIVVYPEQPEGLTMPEPDDSTETYGCDVAGVEQFELAL